ncbi:MAG: hypothetical protein HY064_13905 [Bacteroidetes bacterium]|nr:hypothetical protein [Bacteroidota bacterium]
MQLLPDYLDLTLFRILWTICFLSWLIITPLWLMAMYRSLETIDPVVRKMPPANVWLTMIPLFGFVWQFIVANAVTEGLKEEFTRRGVIIRDSKPGNASGLSANILFCCTLIPLFGILIGVASFIPRIIHLFRIKNYTAQLQHVIDVQNNYNANDQNNFDWEQYRENAMDAVAMIKNEDPDRFKPKPEEPQSPEEDMDRWRKK